MWSWSSTLRPEAHDLLRVPKSWLPRQDRNEAVRKLRRSFRQMGFERMGRTPSYGLSMARLTPTLTDLLRPSG
jgi:hypothetical protein